MAPPPNPYITTSSRAPLAAITDTQSTQSTRSPPKKKRKDSNNAPTPSAPSFDANNGNSDDGVTTTNSNSISISIFNVFRDGFQCRDCNVPVGSSAEAIRRHLKKQCHDDVNVRNVTQLHSKLVAAKKKLNETSPIVPNNASNTETVIRIKCCCCGRHYGDQFNFNKHLKKCGGSGSFVRSRYMVTPAGTFLEANSTTSTVAASVGSVVSHQPISYDFVEKTMAKLIRDDEDVGSFVSLFTPMVPPHGLSFESIISASIDSFEMSLAPHETALKSVLEMAENWLMKRARHDVSMVPGNFRAGLLQFSSQDMGEISQNLTYNFRHKESIVLPEMKRLLMFLWRSNHPLVMPFRNLFPSNDIYFVPKLLTTFFHENVPNLYVHPLVVRFCLFRFFRKQKDGTLKMYPASTNASCAAAVMSLLRSAVCSLICSVPMNMDQFAHNVVKVSQNCRVANILSPTIRRMREMERRKKKSRMVTVDENGMIAVDGFAIEKRDWSRVIPRYEKQCCHFVACKLLFSSFLVCFRVQSHCQLLLADVLVGSDWTKTFDMNNIPSVSSDFTFSLILKGGCRAGVSTVLKNNFDITKLDQLCSYLELAFHGLGLGSLRKTEIQASKIDRCSWHRMTVYYDFIGRKVYTHKTKRESSVEHKLPPSIARLWLVYRQITSPLDEFDSRLVVPRRSASKHTLCCAMAELFRFESVPHATQVRHFWTSILNFLFPKGNLSDALCAEDDAAEASGHSSQTHLVRYSSKFLGAMEHIYRTFHAALGEASSGEASPVGGELRHSDLEAMLRVFFGPNAEYKSPAQRELVEFAAMDTRHGHGDLPCDAGKSMSWTLPVAARLVFGRTSSNCCTVVILPYKFLAAFQYEAACAFMENKTDAWIEILNASDFCRESLPDALAVDGVVPDLLFLSIDALSEFTARHAPSLARLCRSGLIHRFIIDEIHTILVEGFRPAYECLAKLPSFGCPILTLSGSLPSEFRENVMGYIGMQGDVLCSTSQNGVKVIGGGDVLGRFPSDFTFSCNVVGNVRGAVLNTAMKILRSRKDSSVHIILSSKADAEYISSRFESSPFACRLLTSDIVFEEQQEIAREWRDSTFIVLVSTSLAIVGNENSSCRHLIIGGYLFNLMSVVQAINRLRENQRSGGSSVRFLLPSLSPERLESLRKDDRLKFEALAERKLVPNNAALWKTFGSIDGLHGWLVEEEGCRIASLSRRFGKRRHDCGMCDRCKGEPVRVAAVANSVAIQKRNEKMNKALNLLRRLEQQCVVCKRNDCNGENCLPKRSCFRCGGSHFVSQCMVDWGQVLQNKGCYFCLDIHRPGYRTHDPQSCPLQRRLKRLVIESFSKSNSGDIAAFYSRIASDKASFFSFLANESLKL